MGNSLFTAVLWAATAAAAVIRTENLPIQIQTRTSLESHLANVHIDRRQPVEGSVAYTFGHCQSQSRFDTHHTIGESDDEHVSRLVWIIPKNVPAEGCISAWSESGVLLGRSEVQSLHRVRRPALKKRDDIDSIAMNNDSGIDASGPWFDGVAHLESNCPDPVNVEKAKKKGVAIVGAGMSGLMTFLILSQSGLSNISIIEAGNRLGGRVHTEYLSGDPFDYSYQEMGPMRFPYQWLNPETNNTYNITDQQLVFSLGEEMNRVNKGDKNLSVDFIPWLQENSNGLSYTNEFKLPSGLPPTIGQIASNSSLGAPILAVDPETEALAEEVNSHLPGYDFMQDVAKNIYRAHKTWIESGLDGLGGDQWSEYAYMVNYLSGSLNSTDMLGGDDSSFWSEMYDGVYFAPGGAFRTIDGGLNRLPLSFHPLVDDIITMERKIERVRFDSDDSVTLQWRDDYQDRELQSATYDYAVIATPFTAVRTWRLPQLPATITNAIQKMHYTTACKVALEYSERFWEHYDKPIYGSCSTATDIPLIGTVCYPSYNLNGTGPASLLASYISGPIADGIGSMSEEEHVQYVLDAMTEIHGEDTRDLYTGNYNRRCWGLDPLTKAGWAWPSIGQHKLWIPEYFKTYNNMIFVGEHTSFTHAWISSALESGVRGGIQLLLELGLVDEAKEANEKWMGRWIDV